MAPGSGKIAVALSDGMGKGEAAARESERAVNSVLSLLKAGMDPEMALQVLNLLWSMSNRKEMFPTLDLALLDPESRELVIYKIGAAPTVVVRAPRCGPGHHDFSGDAPGARTKKHPGPAALRRPAADQPGHTGTCSRDAAASVTCHTKQRRQVPLGACSRDAAASVTCHTKQRRQVPLGACSRNSERQIFAGVASPEQIEILTAPAMPMGVSEYSEIPCISTLVMPGDLIILMTDGVVDSMHRDVERNVDKPQNSLQEYPELDWLRRLLNRIKSGNLQTICDLIIREAALNYGDWEKDDMTVAVIRV